MEIQYFVGRTRAPSYVLFVKIERRMHESVYPGMIVPPSRSRAKLFLKP